MSSYVLGRLFFFLKSCLRDVPNHLLLIWVAANGTRQVEQSIAVALPMAKKVPLRGQQEKER